MSRRAAAALLFVALLLALTCAAVSAGPAVADARWRAPVPGSVVASFSFAAPAYGAGWHRGVDLAAPPAAPVRAACGGVVAAAGRLPQGGRFVTLRCGPWRVTHLPLAAVAVRPGARVAAGAPLGAVGTSGRHHGLHLGVRRAGRAQGYVDPLRFLRGASESPPPGLVGAPRGRRRTGPPAADPLPAPPAADPLLAPSPAARVRPALVPARPVAASSRPAAASPRAALAPWPVWAGLALVLAGAASGSARPSRRRRRPSPGAAEPAAALSGGRRG
jgi:peptidase M23-like protein